MKKFSFLIVLMTGILFFSTSANASLIIDLFDGGSGNVMIQVDSDGNHNIGQSSFYWSHSDDPSNFIVNDSGDYDYYPEENQIQVLNTSISRINLDDDGESSDDFRIEFWQSLNLEQAFTVEFELPGIRYSQLIPGIYTDNWDSDTEYWGGYELRVGQFDSAPVPEPGTMLLFGTGLLGLAGFTRKKP